MRNSYLKKIFKILSSADMWTLNQIYQFAVNMTKEDGTDKQAESEAV